MLYREFALVAELSKIKSELSISLVVPTLGEGSSPRPLPSVLVFYFPHHSLPPKEEDEEEKRMVTSAKVPENAIFDIEIGGIVHYICQHGDELTEETYDGQMNAPLPVGSAQPGTHGTYVLLGDEVGFPFQRPSLPLLSIKETFLTFYCQ